MIHTMTEQPIYRRQMAEYLARYYGSAEAAYAHFTEHFYTDESGVLYVQGEHPDGTGAQYYAPAGEVYIDLYKFKLEEYHVLNPRQCYICKCGSDHWRVSPKPYGFVFLCPQCGGLWEWEE